MAQTSDIGRLRTSGITIGRRKNTSVSEATIFCLPLPSIPKALRMPMVLLSSLTEESVFTERIAKDSATDTIDTKSMAIIKTTAVEADSHPSE